jgi:hypothetical protein
MTEGDRRPLRLELAVVALLFTIVGSLIMIVFSPVRPLLPRAYGTAGRTYDYLGRIALIAVLLVAWWLMRRTGARRSARSAGGGRSGRYAPLVLGLTIMSAAVSLDFVLSLYLMDSLHIQDQTPMGFALMKLNECAVVVGTVVLLTRTAGGTLGSLYLHRGRLRLGLTIGLIAFAVAVAGSVPMSLLLFKGQDLTLARIIRWAPWLLVFVLANAMQEELLFRGLFLRKLEPLYGRLLSNLLIVFVFTLLHNGATYAADQRLFLAAVAPLAFAWGYVMQKTDSIWGSVLFHAGMDIPIMLGIFSGL